MLTSLSIWIICRTGPERSVLGEDWEVEHLQAEWRRASLKPSSGLMFPGLQGLGIGEQVGGRVRVLMGAEFWPLS